MPKGLYTRTEEHKNRLSKNMKKMRKENSVPWNLGKKWSEEVLKKMRGPRPSVAGDNNPSKRKDVQKKISKAQKILWQNPDYREKMRIINLDPKLREAKSKGGKSQKGKKQPLESVKKGVETRKRNGSYVAWNKGKTGIYTKEVIKKISNSIKKLHEDPIYHAAHKFPIMKGDKNPAWLGGISFLPYGKDFNKELKNKIRKRENYCCGECKKSQKELGELLSIHHIDYDKKNNKESNLIALCRSCHGSTHHNRQQWTTHFERIAV